MSIRINSLTDYSALFSGLPGGSSQQASNFLSDYASIKNGSYAKLMKAYYSDTDSSKKVSGLVNSSNLTADNKKLDKVTAASDSLKSSAEKLDTKDIYKDADK